MSEPTAPPGANQPDHYWAFISYSHQDNLATRADGTGDCIRWADWLHEQLETYRIPDGYRDRPTRTGESMPERFFPTFRDEAELPTAHNLGEQIRLALDRSRFLIVIASPRSARSRYVNEEVRYFRELGRGDRILTLIVDGEPNVRHTPKPGWTADGECFCPALVHPLRPDGSVDDTALLREEPIAADVRVKDAGPPREMRASERDQPDRRALLDFMKLKLIAGLMGAGLDELVQRDKVRQLDVARQRARTLRRWLSSVGVLAILAIAAGVIAFWQRGLAREQNQRAENHARRAEANAAEARSNAEQAKANATEAQANARRAAENLAHADFREGINRLNTPDTAGEALALLARAVRSVGLPAAQARLWTLFQQRQFWAEVPPAPAQLTPAPTERSETPPQRFATVLFENRRRKPDWFSRSADGRTCVTIVNGDITEDTTDKHRFRVWRIDGTPMTPWLEVGYLGETYVSNLRSAHLSADGRLVAVVASPWREPQYVQVWDTVTKKRIGTVIEATGSVPHHQNVSFSQVRFLVQRLPDDNSSALLLLASRRGDASLYVIDAEDAVFTLRARAQHASPVLLAELDAQARWLISVSDDRRVMVTDTTSDDLVGHPFVAGHAIKAIGHIAPDRVRVVTVRDDALEFRLTPRVTVPIPGGVILQEVLSGDAFKLDRLGDDGPNAVHLPVRGTVLLRSADRRRIVQLTRADEVSLFAKTPAGEMKQTWSQRFPSAVYRVRFAAEEQLLVIQTDSFVTEVWDSEANQRAGYPIDESRLFRGANRPAKSLLTSLDASRRRLLTRSFFWDPPNLGLYWFTAWDLESGLPATDQIAIADGGDDEPATTHAEFSADGKLLLMGPGDGKTLSPMKVIQLEPPAALLTGLADAAEALGGFAARDDGTFAPVADRMRKLEAFVAEVNK